MKSNPQEASLQAITQGRRWIHFMFCKNANFLLLAHLDSYAYFPVLMQLKSILRPGKDSFQFVYKTEAVPEHNGLKYLLTLCLLMGDSLGPLTLFRHYVLP